MVQYKNINIFLGRFQPFTAGHMKAVTAGYEANKLDTVILMIANKKGLDSRHPFPDDFIKEEITRCSHIEDVLYVDSADIVKFSELLHSSGYQANLWLTGTDRIAPYTRMAEKYKEQASLPSSFKTLEIARTDEDISATKVREALKDDDYAAYRKLMPDEVKNDRKFYEKLEEYMMSAPEEEPKKAKSKKVKEGMVSLRQYIIESLYKRASNFSSSQFLDDVKEIVAKQGVKNVKDAYKCKRDITSVYDIGTQGLDGQSNGYIVKRFVNIAWQNQNENQSSLSICTFYGNDDDLEHCVGINYEMNGHSTSIDTTKQVIPKYTIKKDNMGIYECTSELLDAIKNIITGIKV